MAEDVSVIHRVFLILDAFRDAPQRGVSEIARVTGLPKSTVFRMARTLTELGVLSRTGNVYRIGIKLFELGRLNYPAEVRDAMYPLLDDLQHVTGHTVQAGLLTDRDVVFFEHHPARPISASPRFESRVPANCSACGKLLLAFAPQDALEEFLGGDLPARTPNSVTEPERLRSRVGPDPTRRCRH